MALQEEKERVYTELNLRLEDTTSAKDVEIERLKAQVLRLQDELQRGNEVRAVGHHSLYSCLFYFVDNVRFFRDPTSRTLVGSTFQWFQSKIKYFMCRYNIHVLVFLCLF